MITHLSIDSKTNYTRTCEFCIRTLEATNFENGTFLFQTQLRI